ncbi:hypothetical protein ABEB36_002394 [Hypothenemus hampei]|uniref:Uncharacterized protein n=1 Tax=Hypothenemus hampei TaxID=57062 RepID=A0ABD1F5L9_HYPHA
MDEDIFKKPTEETLEAISKKPCISKNEQKMVPLQLLNVSDEFIPRESLDFNNLPSPRESLGILHLSTMDLGKESLLNINKETEDLFCKSLEYDKKNIAMFLNDSYLSLGSQEKSFDKEKYLLDNTPQPNWDEIDLSKSSNHETNMVYDKEIVCKKVDEMLGMQVPNLEEKIQLKNFNKCDSISALSISENLSRISKPSQHSLPENPSFNSDHSNLDNETSRLLKQLSEIINRKENLSSAQKNDALHHLNCLRNLLDGNKHTSLHSEDSGRSSVEDCPLIQVQDVKTETFVNNKSQVVFKENKQTSSINRGDSPAVRNKRESTIHSKLMVLNEHKNKRVLQPKREPLRAVLPIEKMAKVNIKKKHASITPERKIPTSSKLSIQSKKNTTPIQPPRLKPMASSTPTNQQPQILSEDNKEETKYCVSKGPLSKTQTLKLFRRNSSIESSSKLLSNNFGTSKLKLGRSFSTGKEPKFITALSQVRQNILSSPYFLQKRQTISNVSDGKETTIKLDKEKKVINKSLEKENKKPTKT